MITNLMPMMLSDKKIKAAVSNAIPMINKASNPTYKVDSSGLKSLFF
ncbi:MAG: hypothetical protein ACKVTZ_02630 [Bacteroidia bacterium]